MTSQRGSEESDRISNRGGSGSTPDAGSKYTYTTYGTAMQFDTEEQLHQHITGHLPAWFWRDNIP